MSDTVEKKPTQGEIAREFVGHFLYKELIGELKKVIAEEDKRVFELFKATGSRMEDPVVRAEMLKETYKALHWQDMLDEIDNHFLRKVNAK